MGVRVGTVVGPVPGGATVVTVSGGSCGRKVLGEGWGDVLVGAVGRGEVDITVRGAGAPTMALVDVLSPLLIMTAVATAPSATTLPRIAATGRHRRSAAQANSPSEQVRPSPEAARALVVRVVLDFPDVPNALVEVVNCVTDGADVIEPLPADGVSGGVSGWPRPNRYGGQGRLLACW